MCGFIPKIIFFDVDDTLLDFTAYQKYALETMCRQFGVEYSDKLLEVFNDVNLRLWRGIEDGSVTRAQLHHDRFRLVFDQSGIRGGDPDKFEAGFRKNIFDYFVKIDGADETLDYLSKKYELCVVSNASLIQQQTRLKGAKIDCCFSKLFMSNELGADKPSKAFFDKVFAALSGVKPEETLLVGDSPTADIAGGNAYGIKTCWFNRDGKSKQKVECNYEIHSLKELIGLF